MIHLQIFDQYLNFISLEEDLFITRHHNTHDLSYFGELDPSVHLKTCLISSSHP